MTVKLQIDPILMFTKFDPTNWWEREADKLDTELDNQRLLDACGLIPHWVIEYLMEGDKHGLKDHLDKAYGFGLYDLGAGGAEIDDKLVYTYPGDAPLWPLISINCGDEGLFLMYQYAICAIPTPDGYFITRMD